MTTTLSLDLPDDAIVAQMYDPATNLTNYKLTVAKTDIPFLVKFLLNGIPKAEKEEISLSKKEEVAKAAGLKYVYRLPSIMRTLMVGAACGIALKTLSQGNWTSPLLHKSLKATLNCVSVHPYLTAISLTGASLLTTQASDETAKFISTVLEGSLSLGKVLRSGCVKAVALSNRYINFWYNSPKTALAMHGSVGLGLALRYSNIGNKTA